MASPRSTTWMSLAEPLTQSILVFKVTCRSRVVVLSSIWISVAILNPSNLSLLTGDLTLQLLRDGAVLGTALLPNHGE